MGHAQCLKMKDGQKDERQNEGNDLVNEDANTRDNSPFSKASHCGSKT